MKALEPNPSSEYRYGGDDVLKVTCQYLLHLALKLTPTHTHVLHSLSAYRQQHSSLLLRTFEMCERSISIP